MRRFVMMVIGSAVTVLLLVAPAAAQQYPPEPGAGPAGEARGGGDLALTGSDVLPLLWLGLAALVLGTVLVFAARRRAAVRTRARRVGQAIA